ncbi:hypothetical protein O6H91_Y133800 [Diphasiastrum complanatum]|nr:hypothetical protein O6H91_Y133800 [Diphasiastrum complanatum]KAJ7299855.1 hypothetical protein O6H91_Y133800 [Diphasiastrum complanatum]
MKNGQAKRTIACVPLIQKAKYAVLLTGTPALSRPMELFKQLQALQPSVYQNLHEFGKRYCTGGVFGMYQGASNHEELHALLKSTIMIRRLKREVLSELPQKRRQQVFLSLDKDGVKQMRALFVELEDVRRRSCNCNEAEMAEKLKYAEKQLISKIYTESGKVKLPVVQEYLTTILETDCKFLVFAHHQQMLDGIQSLLVKKKVGYIRIDGATPAISRHTLATKFQDDQKIQVALLGIRAAGVGLTLTAASTVIFAEMSWTPGDLVQAEDRAHRIGQESAVNVHYLHAHDTVDDLIWDSVQNKLENLGQVLDGKEDNLNASAAPLQSQALLHRQGTLDTFIFSKRFSNSRSDPFHSQESAFCNIKSMPAKEAEHPSESTEADNDIDEEHLNVPKALNQNYLPESSTENVSAKRSKFS